MFGLLRNNKGLEEMFDRNPILLDVRTEMEFDMGSVPNAINIPLHELQQRMSELKKFKRPVVAFCRSGMRSGQASAILNSGGIESINGGSWNSVARRLMTRD